MINFVADRVWNESLKASVSNEFKALKNMTSMAVSLFTGFCLTRLLDHLFDEGKSTFTFLIVESKSNFSEVLSQIIPKSKLEYFYAKNVTKGRFFLP